MSFHSCQLLVFSKVTLREYHRLGKRNFITAQLLGVSIPHQMTNLTWRRFTVSHFIKNPMKYIFSESLTIVDVDILSKRIILSVEACGIERSILKSEVACISTSFTECVVNTFL